MTGVTRNKTVSSVPMTATPPLTLPGKTHVSPTLDSLHDGLIEALTHTARQAIDQRGMFHLALSGGSTPKPFYERLAEHSTSTPFPWEATHVWVVDERCVPEDDPRNNFRMIACCLTDRVAIAPHHLHPIPTLVDDPADAYEHELRTLFGFETTPRLDFVLLGMGQDGHTASLFPHSPALDAHHKLVALNEGPHVTPPPRVTMTYRLLNAARQITVLVTGSTKAKTLRTVERKLHQSGPDPEALPITGIRPTEGQVNWYLDVLAVSGN